MNAVRVKDGRDFYSLKSLEKVSKQRPDMSQALKEA